MGGIEPHPFSWLLWGLATLVVFLVQRSKGAEAGSWVTLLTATACFIICGLTLRINGWEFSVFDLACLALGVTVLGLYLVVVLHLLRPFPFLPQGGTSVAVFATAADLFGYGPTIKKGWARPDKDSALSFFLNGVKFLVALPALMPCSVTTCVYPVTIAIMNFGIVMLLLGRSKRINAQG